MSKSLRNSVTGVAKASLPQYHLIGALDALTDGDVKDRLEDGLPNTLGESTTLTTWYPSGSSCHAWYSSQNDVNTSG